MVKMALARLPLFRVSKQQQPFMIGIFASFNFMLLMSGTTHTWQYLSIHFLGHR